tara:strand:+ start:7327 stop:7944 length:618 start_codon:yes stop_codon:yes gene_type:complete
MTRKITIKELRELIKEEFEEPGMVASLTSDTDATRLAVDSVDDQIDSMLIDFEAYSITKPESDADYLAESLNNFVMSHILLEQDDEDVEPDEIDDEIDQAGEIESEAGDEEEAPSKNKPNIDMDSFTKRVARLAKNYEVLLDVKTVVVNRAIAYLEENYEKEELDEFKEILDNQFDFNLSGPPELPEPPIQVGAAGEGGGLGGGG